jgi:hypothetical protein|nr:MAG TPA: hypothetical protein [Caudoviricetes sp.]
MSLKTIAGQDYEDVCVFQSDNGGIYVAMRDRDTPEPVELVGDSDKFTYGCVESDSECTLFKRIMRFCEVHDLALYDVDVTDIFEGYCKCFKFPGWQDYDYHNERGVLFMVHKMLGTAKQWMDYSDMWDMKDVWSIIDQAKGVTVDAVYAESGRDAVELYLDKGDKASLKTIIDDALGRF